MIYKLLAVWMAVLVVSIPVSFSTIVSVSAKGQDGISNIVREEDTVNFEVAVANNVTPDQIKLNAIIPFDSCTGSGGRTLCTLAQSTDIFSGMGAIPYRIVELKYIGNVTQEVDSKSGTISVDKTGPEVLSLDKTISQNIVTINYNVQDYGFARGDTRNCAGLASIEISNGISKSEIVTGRSCSKSGSVSETKEALSEGHHIVKVKGIDVFGQEGSERTVEFDIDKTPPTVGNGSGPLDPLGNPQEYIGPNPVRIMVEINIEGGDLDPNSVYGDFSSVGYANSYVKGSCIGLANNRSKCTFSLYANAGASGTFSYTITAADKEGNSVTSEGSLSLTFDGTGPTMSGLVVEGITDADGNVYLLPGMNRVTATVSDEGIGFDESQVYMDLSGIGLGNKVSPTSCEAGSCVWSNIPNTMPDNFLGSISFNQDSVDLLGNKLELPSTSISIKSDRAEPRYISHEIDNVGTAYTEAYENLIKTGDMD
ncbi:hypothetical protein ACFLZX_01340 [Nanoarchaeota archaeon]